MALIVLFFLSVVAPHRSNAAFLEPRGKTLTPANIVAQPAIARTWANTTNINLVGDKSGAAQPSAVVRTLLSKNSSVYSSGIVYFLILVNDDLPHGDIWQKFFLHAPVGAWKALIHCKDPAGCARNGVFQKNPNFIQVSTTPTWYCHDLVTAMAHLVTRALQLQMASYGDREKFVFLSESTLPIKPFYEVHGALMLDDSSDFCLFPSDQWGSASIDGSFVKLLKHHQWVVLSREHAELFSRKWVSVNAQSQWRIWLKSGSWESQSKYVYPRNFYYPATANSCTDEWALFATIFGALEPMSGARQLPGFGSGHVDMNLHTTQGRCRTWTYWDNSWDPAATALASQLVNDFHGSSLSCFPKCHARPTTIERLSIGSLHALRRSPFLFARKFSPSLSMPEYGVVIFGQ